MTVGHRVCTSSFSPLTSLPLASLYTLPPNAEQGIASKFGNTLTVVNPGCGFAEIAAAQKLQVSLSTSLRV